MATLILLTRSPQVCESRGLCAFFDRSDLLEISEEALRDKVLASKVVITVLDPHTFNSEWVRLENEWAARAGVPIVPVFDEDRWDWKGQLDKWQRVYPSFFTRQAVTVSKAFRRQSMQKLMQAARPDCLVILVAAAARCLPSVSATTRSSHGGCCCDHCLLLRCSSRRRRCSSPSASVLASTALSRALARRRCTMRWSCHACCRSPRASTTRRPRRRRACASAPGARRRPKRAPRSARRGRCCATSSAATGRRRL